MSEAPSSESAAPAAPAAGGDAQPFRSTRELTRDRSWAWRLLGRFSSVRSAAALIAALAVVIAVATAYEAAFGAAAAGARIYRTGWFAALFALLALNIFGAAAVRWPWRRHQIGFVVVHTGLLTLILGFTLAGNDRLDGSLIAPPGREAWQLELPRDQVTIVVADRRAGVELDPLELAGYPSFARFMLGAVPAWRAERPPLRELPEPLALFTEARDGADVRVTALCLTGAQEPGWAAAPTGDDGAGPAARVALSARTPMSIGPGFEPLASAWLSRDEPVASIGPLTATLGAARSPRLVEDFLAPVRDGAAAGRVRVYRGDERFDAEVPEALPATIELAPDLALAIERYVPNPRVRDDGLTQDDAAPFDPFVLVRIGIGAGDARRWRDTVLSPRHLLRPLGPEWPELLYDHPAAYAPTGDASAGGAWLQLLQGPDGRLHARWATRSKGLAGTASVDAGAEWSGDLVGAEGGPMRLRADLRWLPRAARAPEPVAMEVGHEDRASRWLRLEASKGGARGAAWIRRGEAAPIALSDGTTVLARYDTARYSLKDRHGFALTLDRFDEGKDPGGVGSASFASEVSIRPITDEERTEALRRATEGEHIALARLADHPVGRWVPPALPRLLRGDAVPPQVEPGKHLITMNEPLQVGDVTLYQTSFFPEPGEDGAPTGRQVSVFTVAQDRGRWCKYIGSLLLVAGILIMYVLRRTPRRAQGS